ncbi:hypothetical protein CBL_07883 [Carabus blaptoides fortunei]
MYHLQHPHLHIDAADDRAFIKRRYKIGTSASLPYIPKKHLICSITTIQQRKNQDAIVFRLL